MFRSALISTIYRKTLHTNKTSLSSYSRGQVKYFQKKKVCFWSLFCHFYLILTLGVKLGSNKLHYLSKKKLYKERKWIFVSLLTI